MNRSTISFTFAAIAAIGTMSTALAQDAAQPKAGDPIIVQQGDVDGAFVSQGRFAEPDGEKMYRRVCAACHMTDAAGAAGAGHYPSLVNNPKLAASGYPLLVIVKGLNGMPPIGDMMTDKQVADVTNYIRTHFGNSYTDAVTAEDVKALR